MLRRTRLQIELLYSFTENKYFSHFSACMMMCLFILPSLFIKFENSHVSTLTIILQGVALINILALVLGLITKRTPKKWRLRNTLLLVPYIAILMLSLY